MSSRPKNRRITQTDVAELAGVDKAVVSRVLSGDTDLRVREDTRKRVHDAVDRLGYRPNAIARSLRTATTGAIGLTIPDFTNPVYSEIIAGAIAATEKEGRVLLTASAKSGGSPLDLLRTGRVDALILAGTPFDEPVGSAVHLPVLTINRRIEGLDRWVVLDDVGASRIAVEHLIELGHRKIAHISGPDGRTTAQRRLAGFVAAMSEAGIGVSGQWIVDGRYTPEGGAAAMRSLLEMGGDPPTAVLVGNFASAIGALHELEVRGVEVPADMSVVAIHDLPLAGFLTPPLTTVRMPLSELGRLAVELVTSTDSGEPIEIVLSEPMNLIERRSTAPPRSTS